MTTHARESGLRTFDTGREVNAYSRSAGSPAAGKHAAVNTRAVGRAVGGFEGGRVYRVSDVVTIVAIDHRSDIYRSQ